MPTEPFPPPGYFLRIKDWDTYFERAQTRRIEGPLSWVAIPTKQDGLKFSRLIARQNGFFCLGAFICLVEIGAKCEKRGTFWNSGSTPMTVLDFAGMTGGSARYFERALKILISKEIGWIELLPCSERTPSVVGAGSDMREEKRRKEKSTGGLSLVFQAVGKCCGLELELVDARTAQKINTLIEDFRGMYDDWSEKELAEAFRQFGRWYFEEEWKGHRPTVDKVREKWRSFREWSIEKRKRDENLTLSGNPRITAPG